MQIKSKYYPFSINVESKTSQQGNPYLSIGIGCTKKGQDGNYTTTWFNLIDKKDLLVLASACENTFHYIVAAENIEREANKPQTTQATATPVETATVDDALPF